MMFIFIYFPDLRLLENHKTLTTSTILPNVSVKNTSKKLPAFLSTATISFYSTRIPDSLYRAYSYKCFPHEQLPYR